MAKKTWNEPIGKHTDWGGDDSTGNLPVSGAMVQKFIKDSFGEKAGLFHYDETNNRYIVFADEEARDAYLEDPTRVELVIGTFDAPFNYTAEITLRTPAYNAVFLGSTGNYIEFTFDVKNKQGASTGENVTVTYTFIRNAVKKVVTETRRYGESVRFNIDKYLEEGTNSVIVGISGQTTLAATTAAMTYQVVNLVLTDETNIAMPYNLVNGAAIMEVPFTVSGYGTKVVEWYLDGVQLAFVKNDDEVVDVSASRVKYITLANMRQGRHSLQIRAYTTINGERFYTDTLYRDILVYTGASNTAVLGISTTIPARFGLVQAGSTPMLYNAKQFVPYVLKFATYSPKALASLDVVIKIDGNEAGIISSQNGEVNEFSFIPRSIGRTTIDFMIGDVAYSYVAVVEQTTMNLQEINTSLLLDFSAAGRSNNSADKDKWTYGAFTGTFSGFNWNSSSGWVGNRLRMNAGSSFEIDCAPLGNNPTALGKTVEIEFKTLNVKNDDAVICDLRNDSGVGILITATKVSLVSANGVSIETEFKSEENVRIAFVINRATGTSNRCLSFIYANGCITRGEKWAVTDRYTSDKAIRFSATDEAELELKAIRIYDMALTSDQVLNNHILYRDTIEEMMEVYDRNDVYLDGTTTFSPDKMMGRLPVMIVTGDIPVLENTSDKDTQIVVDIDYYNMQDMSRSFRMKGAAMRPQGTSSMGYPKKNFRIYTNKIDGTVLYDSEGKVVKDKLYSFKENAQPVDCWCLKADYAESSGTHNTGIARLWNDALMNAQIDGEYRLRTQAQKAAIAADYPYDVRTTIDGFPILLFYRPTANDDLIFIGKYNFNNDKSTESVFGFEGIPGFDNSKMQCWEVLNNGNPLALFLSTEDFDEKWDEAFEARYPDKSRDVSDLKAFCEWMVGIDGDKDRFLTEKWEHLDVYKMAAYWCYLMRHAGADQFVKNAMFTSEDGVKWYYILYDNDTINGLINTGRLKIKPTDDRLSVDESGSFLFAGARSVLWNMLEADDEFKDIVSKVDNALYSAGISYINTIKIFDEQQADKWVERVYNQDAHYKYIGPFVEKGIDNLFMLQGKRDLHRKWWLAKRFSIYDAKFVSGSYKSQAIEIKCINDTPAGQSFSLTAGYPLDYGYGINNVPREFGVTLDVDESHIFVTTETVNLGDPIRIYAAPHISELNLDGIAAQLAVVNVANAYDEALGTQLKKLKVGLADSRRNYEVTEISGLKMLSALEELDVSGMKAITSLDLTNQRYLKRLYALHSGVASVEFAKGAPVEILGLPAQNSLSLEQLPYLKGVNLTVEDMSNLLDVTIKGCPHVSNDFTWAYEWYWAKGVEKNRACSFVMDNVNWKGVHVTQFLEFIKVKGDGGILSLKGSAEIVGIESAEQILTIQEILGENVFNPSSEFFLKGDTFVSVDGPEEVLEGDEARFEVTVFPSEGSTSFRLSDSSRARVDASGIVYTQETGEATESIVLTVSHTDSEGAVTTIEKNLTIIKRIYPEADATELTGPVNPTDELNEYRWSSATPGVTGRMDASWTLEGDITSFIEIEESDSERCVLKKLRDVEVETTGKLTLTLRKVYNGALVLTKSLNFYMLNPSILMTSSTNPEAMAIMYSAGLAANETYMTKAEAASVTAEQLKPTSTASDSVFSKYGISAGITLKSFPELEHFTGLTKIPSYLFHSYTTDWHNLGAIRLPESVTEIEERAFSACEASFIDTKNVTTIGAYAFCQCHVKNNDASKRYLDVVIRSKVASIGVAAFSDSYVRNLNIEDSDSPLSIPERCFYNSCIESLTLPDRVTNIDARCFGRSKDITTPSLKSVYGGDGIETFASNAFYGQHGVETFECAGYMLLDFTKDPDETAGNYSLDNYKFGGDKISYENSTDEPVIMWRGGMGINVTPYNSYMYFDIYPQSGSNTPMLVVYDNLAEKRSHKLSMPRIGYRTVKVTVSGVANDDISAARFVLSYTKPDGSNASETIDQGVETKLNVLGGTSVTCTLENAISGYECSPVTNTVPLVGTSVLGFTMTFTEKVDIYVQHKDGTLYTADEWTASGNPEDDANGMALISATHKFVVCKKSLLPSEKYTMGDYSIIQSAINDVSGEINTERLIAEASSGAAQACKDFIFPCGKPGYMPSLAEGRLYVANYANMGMSQLVLYTPNYKYWLSYMYPHSQTGKSITKSDSSFDAVIGNDESLNQGHNIFPFLPYGKLVIRSNKPDAQFSVTYTNINDVATTKTLGVGNHRLDVKYNTEMGITPISTYDGLKCETKAFIYGWDTEEQSMNYLRGNGVYIQHVDGNLYTGDEWTAGGFANDVANGIAVVSDETKFVVYVTDSYTTAVQNGQFGGWGSMLTSNFVSESQVLLDYSGREHTEDIKSLGGTYPLCSKVDAVVFPNGKTHGYIPAAGEVYLIYNNKENIKSLITLLGFYDFTVQDITSSSESDSKNMWKVSLYNGETSTYDKSKSSHTTLVLIEL